MSNSLLGLLSLIVGVGLLWFVFNSYKKDITKNMKKDESFKDLLEKGARGYQAEQHRNKDFLGLSGGWWILILILLTYWWIHMEFSMIPIALIWVIMIFFRVGKF